jgi:cytochrome P450
MMSTGFNPFSQAFRANPYEVYASLQQSAPQHSLGMWVVTRYDDVKSVLKDRSFSSALIPSIIEKRLSDFAMVCPEVSELGRKAIVFTDNPEHARLRRLANLVFNQRSLEELRSVVARIAHTLFDTIAGRDSADIISSLAEPMPIRVLAEWMGLRQEDCGRIKKWTHEVRFFLEPGFVSKRRFQEIYVALLEFMDFFCVEISKRKDCPGNDLISLLLTSKTRDDGFTEDEIIYTCIMAYVAGGETTTALLGNAAFLFALYPDQLETVRSGKVSIQSAANEVFRYESPLQMTKRLCLEDISVAGIDMVGGDQVLLCMGAANRDPAIFPEPHVFRVDRKNSEQHLAFGYGFHSCLGAYLAQIQIETYLAEIVSSGITFSLNRQPEWLDHTLIVRGLKQLDVAVKV